MPTFKTSVLIAPVLIMLLFGTTLCGIDRLGFRDVSHFYTPLYDYVDQRCDEQWLPLWNPLDQTGQPLLGETTTAVLYPVRHLIYALPFSAETTMAWYVVVHLILAAFATYLLSRWFGLPEIAATSASLIYPLSGSVLFLYTNPPFLVGAAWLPIVLGALIAPHAGSSRVRIIFGGAAMAMMILGGDPQSALHVMIIASLVMGARFLRRRSSGSPWLVLAGIPLVAATLSLPQLTASIAWSRQSERVTSSKEHWATPPIVGGKRYEAFQYSFPPWHLAELTTPNAFGSFLPINARLSRLLPGDGKSWTPSIYMGMLVLIALIAGCRSRQSGPWRFLFLLSIGLSLGHFGLAWFLQAMSGRLSHVDSAIGGPYWVFYQFLPGYDAFRYPAKWLSLAALAASLMTAQVVSTMNQESVQRIATRLAVVACLALCLVQSMRWIPGLGVRSNTSVDEFWGPLDVSRGIFQSSSSLGHSLVTLLAIVAVTRWSTTRKWTSSTWKHAVVGILAVDLALSGLGLIYRVSVKSERAAVAAIGMLPDQDADASWMRTQSGRGWPDAWRMKGDGDRLQDVEASTRASWFGRWHLASRAHTLNNMVSIRSQASADFWNAATETTQEMTVDQRNRFWHSVRRWLGIPNVLHTSGQVVEVEVDDRIASLVDLSYSQESIGSELLAYAQWRTQISTPDIAQISNRLEQIAFEPGSEWTDGQLPIIVDAIESSSPKRTAGDRLEFEHEVTLSNPEVMECELFINHDALVTRPVIQDGSWTASYAPHDPKAAAMQPTMESDEERRDDLPGKGWQSLEVVSVDGITQGVILPKGSWKLRFLYQPTWIGWTIGTSAIAWMALLIVTIRSRRDLWASFRPFRDQATDASS